MNDKTTKLSTAIVALGILMLSIVLYSISMTGLVFVEKEQLVSVYFYFDASLFYHTSKLYS